MNKIPPVFALWLTANYIQLSIQTDAYSCLCLCHLGGYTWVCFALGKLIHRLHVCVPERAYMYGQSYASKLFSIYIPYDCYTPII